MHVSIDYTLELELTIQGDYVPGSPMILDDAGHDAYIDDITVVGVAAIRWNARTRKHDKIDLLAGVDGTHPEVLKLLNNIAVLVADEADEALLDAVADRDDDRDRDDRDDDRCEFGMTGD